MLVIVAGLIAVIVTLIALRATRERRAPPVLSDAAMADSADVANAQHRWVRYLYWVGRLDLAHPRNSDLTRRRGAGWHNYAVEARPVLAIARPALRTSIERIGCERRALVLLDSAAALATTPEHLSNAHIARGMLFEHLGLPGDALIAYERVRLRYPDNKAAQSKVFWVRAALGDPAVPDTVKWARLNRRLPKPETP